MSLRWCAACVMSDSRPDLSLDESGVCDACRSTARKATVDWEARGRAWSAVCEDAKRDARARTADYDAVVGVSGGKDSHWQVAKALDAGLRVLGVCFEPSQRTEPGTANLANLARYCDILEVRRNATVYHRLRRLGLRQVGDSEWPGHLGIWTAVTREAVLRRIPLVMFGENPQGEYGGPAWSKEPKPMDRAWVAEFGGLLGLRVQDLIDEHGFTADELVSYRWPSEAALAAAPVRGVFLGDYFAWDSVTQARWVRDHMGFRWAERPPDGAVWPFENLDDSICVIFHDALGVLKFGYSRAHAQLSIEIRHGHRTRAEAQRTLTLLAVDRYPPPHVEAAFCAGIGMTPTEVRDICETYANEAIWERGSDGRFIGDDDRLRRKP